jgi:hypothetical protein
MRTQVVKALVPGEGFEPSVEDPKSSALPLGHPGSVSTLALALHAIPHAACDPRTPAGVLDISDASVDRRRAVAGHLCVWRVPVSGREPGPSPGGGNVSGRVLAVPCAPVEKAGTTCAGRPVAKLELDYVKGDAVAASTVTDSGGSYVVSLAAGTYAVRLKTYMRVISGPLTLTLGPGSSLVANYLLDSGIRVPLPQQ